MVGFAKWNYPHHLNEEQLAQGKATASRPGPFPGGTNGPLQDDIMRQLQANYDKWVNHEKTFCKSLKSCEVFHSLAPGFKL